jgi:hypothetical protein
MSERHRRVRCVSCTGWVLLFISVDALAAGPASDQGVLLAGQGLDWQRSGTEVQSVFTFPSTTFPPGTLTKAMNGIEFNISACTPLTPGAPVAICRVQAKRLTATPPQPTALFCSRWLDDSSSQSVRMFALDAVHDGRGGFRFNDPGGSSHEFTLACGAENLSKVSEAEWKSLGAIGKCLLWPFPRQAEPGPPTCVNPPPRGFPPLPNKDTAKFQSCVRAIRADYCGDGVSHTKDYTVIDLYDNPGGTPHIAWPAFLLEANWKQDGAICVLHARFVSLPPSCRAKFPVQVSLFPVLPPREGGDLTTTGMRGTDYWCKGEPLPKGCNKDGQCYAILAAQRLLTSGVLMDDSLLQP